jgi:hypothetical protein
MSKLFSRVQNLKNQSHKILLKLFPLPIKSTKSSSEKNNQVMIFKSVIAVGEAGIAQSV